MSQELQEFRTSTLAADKSILLGVSVAILSSSFSLVEKFEVSGPHAGLHSSRMARNWYRCGSKSGARRPSLGKGIQMWEKFVLFETATVIAGGRHVL